jgi:D-alanine-D-alanine ligase
VQASAIAIDKLVTKRIWLQESIPTPRYRVLTSGDREELNAAVDELGLPLITKPPHEGSTIGIMKATGYSDMADAYALAAKYDAAVLAEQFIAGRELTCAVLGEGRGAEALPLVEIRAPGANYDYHNKYFSDETEYLCPAPVDSALAADLQRLCVRAYNVLGARGWGRVDLMLSERGEPFLLELNTSPGMTGHSLVPMAARAVGMGYEDLVLRILQGAALDDGGRA